MLSEKLFLVLVAGSVLGLVGTFVFNRDALRASRRAKATPIRSTALLAGGSRPTTADAARRGPATPPVSGSGHPTGIIIATEQRELSANARRAASQSPAAAAAPAATSAAPASPRATEGARELLGALVSGVEPPEVTQGGRAAPATAPARPVRSAAGGEAVSVFTPSKIGLPLRMKAEDAWTAWPDANRKNITGSQGTEALETAFELVTDSRAGALAEDLVRKGIPVSFGNAAEFTGELSNVIAFFHSSPEEAIAAGVPVTVPSITFNPLFLHEDPKVLATALVHEATHFQQFLDGSAWDGSHTAEDLEFQAWSNEAAFWEEIRASVWPINTFLEQQSELAYRTALRGEGALRDLLAALEWS